MSGRADPVAHVGRFVERHFESIRSPGVAVGLTGRDGLLGVIVHGTAELAAGTPVRPGHLFQVGSISKSFTAIAVLLLSEEGRLDLHAPVTEHLPWFEVRSPAPVTVHHLLTHSAGLPIGREFTGEAAHELRVLAEQGAGFAPGTRFHYSNPGYKALGLVVEAVAGQPWWEIVGERILGVLGMDATDPITTDATRARSVGGHVPAFDDRPWHPRYGLVLAPWYQSDTADGAICSTAEDMSRYVRMLLAGGHPVLSEPNFALLTQRAVEVDDAPGDFYGYGLVSRDAGGRRRIRHTGSTVGFTAWMELDLDDGVGVVVLANASSNREPVASFALRTLSAFVRGDPLPEVPEARPLDYVEGAGAYAGTFRSDAGELTLTARDERLFLRHGGEDVPLLPDQGDRFVVPHADFERFLLWFERDDDAVTLVTHGERWWASDRSSGPAGFERPEDADAICGHWRSQNPWYSNFRVLVRRGSLRLILGWGDEDLELVPLGDRRFRVGAEPWMPERVGFDSEIAGRPTRALLDGAPFYRTFTP